MHCFITGTDTGVGKTVVATELVRRLREAGRSVCGFKPIACGDREDAERLLEACGSGVSLEEINPVWFKAPAAPWVAAREEGKGIDFEQLDRAFQALAKRFESVIVEGAGGWLVPLSQSMSIADLARRWGLPVVLVAGNRLGALNHTFLTLESIRAYGVHLNGVVLSDLPGCTDWATSTNEEILRAAGVDPLVRLGCDASLTLRDVSMLTQCRV